MFIILTNIPLLIVDGGHIIKYKNTNRYKINLFMGIGGGGGSLPLFQLMFLLVKKKKMFIM